MRWWRSADVLHVIIGVIEVISKALICRIYINEEKTDQFQGRDLDYFGFEGSFRPLNLE